MISFHMSPLINPGYSLHYWRLAPLWGPQLRTELLLGWHGLAEEEGWVGGGTTDNPWLALGLAWGQWEHRWEKCSSNDGLKRRVGAIVHHGRQNMVSPLAATMR